MKHGTITILAAVLAILAGNQAHGVQFSDGESFAVFNGVRHWYRIAGSTRGTTPLVILHGGPGGNAYVFEHTQGRSLEQYATLIYYDQRGGGRSAAPIDPNAYGMDLLVADLEALRTHLGIAKISLLGFSFGAELALEYAVAHPDKVERMVLQSPNAGDYRRMAITETYAMRSVVQGRAADAVDKLIQTPIASPAIRFKELWNSIDRETAARFQYHNARAASLAKKLEMESGFTNTGLMAKVMFSDTRHRNRPLIEDAAKLVIPTLVLVGAFDRTTGVDVARDLATAMPHARLVVFPESAHYPDIEEPDAYSTAIAAFLTNSPQDR
jgi:proline iminopeptidase